MVVKKKVKTKMAMYRSKRSGKIYKAAKWPDTNLVVILVKYNKAGQEHIDYSIGPFKSMDIAARVLKERAELCGWEEIKDDWVY